MLVCFQAATLFCWNNDSAKSKFKNGSHSKFLELWWKSLAEQVIVCSLGFPFVSYWPWITYDVLMHIHLQRPWPWFCVVVMQTYWRHREDFYITPFLSEIPTWVISLMPFLSILPDFRQLRSTIDIWSWHTTKDRSTPSCAPYWGSPTGNCGKRRYCYWSMGKHFSILIFAQRSLINLDRCFDIAFERSYRKDLFWCWFDLPNPDAELCIHSYNIHSKL